jgi:N-dimethylarginine dimethylaminohydrolase
MGWETAIRHQRALMCSPRHFVVRDTKNPFMTLERAVDVARAAAQWEALRAAFEQTGVSVSTIEPVDDLEDMTFAANQAFVGGGAQHKRFIVPSRMRFASREREVPYYVAWFRSNGYEVIDLRLETGSGEYLEGHGDLLAHPNDSHVWAGYGIRSSHSGVVRFSAAMKNEGIRVTPLELVDETFYHLDTCFAPLSAESALVHSPALSEAAFRLLREAWPRLHEVSRENAARFVCNGVAVNGRYIVSYLPADVAAVVRSEGLTPLVVDVSEFEKAGGSVFCLKSFLD